MCPSAVVKLLSLKMDIRIVFITLLSHFFTHSPGHLTHHILYLFIIVTFTTCLFPPHKLQQENFSWGGEFTDRPQAGKAVPDI